MAKDVIGLRPVSPAVVKTTKGLVEMFASATDAFLQEFQDAVNRNVSGKDVVIAAARLAQLGASMTAVFKAASSGASNGPEDLKLANDMCEQVHTMLQRRLDRIVSDGEEEVEDEEPLLTGKPDRSAN